MPGISHRGFSTDTSNVVAGAKAARRDIRSGEFAGGTAGVAPGAVQGNVVILPRDWAVDFHRFCYLNPKPCPLIGMSEPGNPFLPMLGDDIDIRSDVLKYRVFRDGIAVDEMMDVGSLWRDDLVTFVLGCSYSFEEPLIQAGLSLRHLEMGVTVPMYTTGVETTPAGPFRGPMVTSMRPLTPADAIRAIQITSRFPNVHGAPVHFGDPSMIGVADIDEPEFGDQVEFREGEIPVFWACGVTSQAVVERAKPPFCITHMPGHMLITDKLNAELAVL
ncbi:MAG: putative hydro-lyase [Rhodospirillales bacterium]|nr:putative hydro-lyase [Rhodospirillales bacterium]